MKMSDELVLLDKWDETIRALIPKDAFEAINLSEYLSLVREKYAEMFPYPKGAERSVDLVDVALDNFEIDIKRIQEIVKDTYFVSCFLPCHHDLVQNPTVTGRKAEVLVAHPYLQYVEYITLDDIPKTPLNKHLNIRTMKIAFKRVMKMKQIRNFSKPNSVFADWAEDTTKKLDKAFELDMQFLKTPKFIKDPYDLQETHNVLK